MLISATFHANHGDHESNFKKVGAIPCGVGAIPSEHKYNTK